MGDVRVDMNFGPVICPPTPPFLQIVLQLGSATAAHVVSKADAIQLIDVSNDAADFAESASNLLPWYDGLADEDPKKTEVQNSANAKKRVRALFYTVYKLFP